MDLCMLFYIYTGKVQANILVDQSTMVGVAKKTISRWHHGPKFNCTTCTKLH